VRYHLQQSRKCQIESFKSNLRLRVFVYLINQTALALEFQWLLCLYSQLSQIPQDHEKRQVAIDSDAEIRIIYSKTADGSKWVQTTHGERFVQLEMLIRCRRQVELLCVSKQCSIAYRIAMCVIPNLGLYKHRGVTYKQTL
jgi:hypothetical protein